MKINNASAVVAKQYKDSLKTFPLIVCVLSWSFSEFFLKKFPYTCE